MHRRNVLNSPRLLELKKRRRRVFLNKIIFCLVGLIIILVALSFLSRLDKLNIQDVEISGNKVLDGDVLKRAVEGDISGSYLWLFPKTNIFFYPENAIEKDLNNKFKRIKDISIRLKDRKTLEVVLTERKPLYTWCGAAMPTTPDASQKCYFLDDDGFIFDEAPYFSGEVYFKFYGPAQAGSYFLAQNFKQLISLKETLESMKLKPVVLDAENQDVKIFLSATQTSTPEIIFKLDADYQKIAENLQAALATEPLKIDFNKKYSSLLYIDLRFGNKVYYKFR